MTHFLEWYSWIKYYILIEWYNLNKVVQLILSKIEWRDKFWVNWSDEINFEYRWVETNIFEGIGVERYIFEGIGVETYILSGFLSGETRLSSDWFFFWIKISTD